MLTLDREPGEPRANILVEKLGEPRVAPPTVLDETLFYKGSENLMVYRTEYNLQFNCIYELGYYPFDIQTCTMEVSILLYSFGARLKIWNLTKAFIYFYIFSLLSYR